MYTEPFEEIWAARPKRVGTDNKRAAFRCYQTRLRQGCTHEEMLAGVKGYAEFCRSERKVNTPFVMMLSTFLGPNLYFQDDFTPRLALPDDDEMLAAFAQKHALPPPKIGIGYKAYRRELEEAIRG